MRAGGGAGGGAPFNGYRRDSARRWQGAASDVDDLPGGQFRAGRRLGTPVAGFGASIAPEDESQDAPVFAIGARVKHRKFGSGTIAELVGAGRDAKVKVDFDDQSIGRKTLVIAQANLERGNE
jgi:DNA helicase-2/ATP-dependent DNA helicase PcrA